MPRPTPLAPLVTLLLALAVGASLHHGTAAPLGAQQRPAESPLRPGDRIVVTVADSTDVLSLRADGQVVLPRLGAVSVSGLGPSAAEDSIAKAYGTILRRPDVRVTALRRIIVQGEVPRADVLYVDATMGLAEALALAGGVGPEGHRKRVDLWRGGERVGRFDSRSGAALTVPLESGDVVIVARANWMSRNPFAVVALVSSVVSLVIALGR